MPIPKWYLKLKSPLNRSPSGVYSNVFMRIFDLFTYSPVPEGAYKMFQRCARLISFELKISNNPCPFTNLSTWRDPTEVFPRYTHLSTWWQELLVLAIHDTDAHRSQKPCVVRFYGRSYGAMYRLVTNGILAYETLFTYSDYTNTKHSIWIVYWRCVSHLI